LNSRLIYANIVTYLPYISMTFIKIDTSFQLKYYITSSLKKYSYKYELSDHLYSYYDSLQKYNKFVIKIISISEKIYSKHFIFDELITE
jgi:hypothetical protein